MIANQQATGTGQLATDATGQVVPAQPAFNIGSTTLSANPSVNTDSNLLTSPPVTSFDINAALKENMAARADTLQQIAQAYKPSGDELALQQKALAQQNGLTQYDIETQKALYGMQGQGRGIPISLIVGDQQKLNQQRNLDRQSLVGDAQLTQNQLGIDETNRENQISSLQTQLQAGQADQNTIFQLGQLQRQQQQDYYARVDQLTTKAQNTLNNLTQNFAGLSFDDLSADTQNQLTSLANAAGVPPSLLKAGLQNIKDQSALKAQSDSLKQQQAATLALSTKYADAGILPTDTPDIIAQKISHSKIYQAEIRPPAGPAGEPPVNPNKKDSSGNTATDVLAALIQQDPSKWTPDQWAQARTAFVGDFGEKNAEALYDNTITKPKPVAPPSAVSNAYHSVVNFFKNLF